MYRLSSQGENVISTDKSEVNINRARINKIIVNQKYDVDSTFLNRIKKLLTSEYKYKFLMIIHILCELLAPK